jgi:predicted GNAT family acetyltransferase
VDYDPEKPATAPTNDDVSDWLEKRGVAKRVAEVMAQILRADGLKAGSHNNP